MLANSEMVLNTREVGGKHLRIADEYYQIREQEIAPFNVYRAYLLASDILWLASKSHWVSSYTVGFMTWTTRQRAGRPASIAH